jgi:hypothetical protein
MNRTLDFSAVWNDAMAMLARHKEALFAVAGILTFLPQWIFGFFAGEPDVEGLTKAEAINAAQLAFYAENGLLLFVTSLIGIYGGFSLYALLLRKDMPSVGAALLFALRIFPVYFAAMLLVTVFNLFGLLAFIVGAFYLSGRFFPVAAVIAAEPEKGIIGGIKRSWDLTQGAGWVTFFFLFIVILVYIVIIIMVEILIGLLCSIIAGPEGIPLVQTGFSAFVSTIGSVVISCLGAAIYRHFVGQDNNQTTPS